MTYRASKRSAFSSQTCLILGLLLVLGLSVARIHLRVQTTLIGYDIGKLKSEEARLLEERSRLRMQLAKLTTRQHLSLMADTMQPETTATSLASAH